MASRFKHCYLSVCLLLCGLTESSVLMALENSALLDHQQLHEAALQYLQGVHILGGDKRIELSLIDPQLQLRACDNLEFSTPSKHLEGNIRLRVQCRTPEAWSIFLGAAILHPVNYFVLNRSVDTKKPLEADDLLEVHEYKAHPTPGLCGDKSKIIGLTLSHALKAGSAIRFADLSSEAALSRGQTVTVVSKGKGFEINRTGRLLSNSFDGQQTQVQVASKQIINGIARKGGIVEVSKKN